MDEALPEKGSYILNIGKVDLLPSKKTLTVAEVNLLIERKDDCLAKLLAPLRADYDYILVDTGPSLGSLTINAFTAADEIIIPVDPELFALVGLKELTETISKIKQNLNPKVEIIGILFTKCSKRTTLYRQTSEQVRSVFGHLPIFESQIPATVQVGTANSKGLSVMELDAKRPAATAYMNLAKEVLAYAYQIITSRDHPAMMYAPDLSKWLFNQMLGMGDMEHNRKLREERENKRPVITDTKQEIALWNIWVYYQKDIMRRLAQQKNTGGGASDDE